MFSRGDNPFTRREFLRAAALTGMTMTAPSAFAVTKRQAVEPAPTPAEPIQTPPAAPEFKRFPFPAPPGKPVEAHVHVNQVGYLPDEPKRAVITAIGPLSETTFSIVEDDVTPQTHFRGQLTGYTSSGDVSKHYFKNNYFAAFDSFARPGRYRVRLADGTMSAPFSIGSTLYPRLIPLMLSYFAVQRCGPTQPSQHGLCHRDDGVIVGGPRHGQSLDASGGWHDAGDYLKFVETTSYVTAIMLTAYERFPLAFASRLADTQMPLLLAHAKVGTDWLLKMHPTPDEFYYQVGDSSDHDSWRLPECDCLDQNKNWKPRAVYYGVGANLAGRTAAALGLAARLYRRYDRRYADACLAAAQSAFQLGMDNMRVLTTEPEDYYPETTWHDDMEWGAAVLYDVTRNPDYLDAALRLSRLAGPANDHLSVYNTHAVAHAALYPNVSEADRERLRDYLRADADHLRRRIHEPYGLCTEYQWGTAEAAAGSALTCLLFATMTTGDEAEPYLTTARNQRDFVLGCNPFGLSCLIGAGTRYPQFPHHQVANLKNAELSGAVIGGPTSVRSLKNEKFPLEDAEFHPRLVDVNIDDLPDDVAAYRDVTQNYIVNEPANDYTVDMLYLTAFYYARSHPLRR